MRYSTTRNTCFHYVASVVISTRHSFSNFAQCAFKKRPIFSPSASGVSNEFILHFIMSNIWACERWHQDVCKQQHKQQRGGGFYTAGLALCVQNGVVSVIGRWCSDFKSKTRFGIPTKSCIDGKGQEVWKFDFKPQVCENRNFLCLYYIGSLRCCVTLMLVTLFGHFLQTCHHYVMCDVRKITRCLMLLVRKKCW